MPTDLDTLMNLDPLSLSDRDMDDLISHYRRLRAKNQTAEKAEAGALDSALKRILDSPAKATGFKRRV